MQEKRIPHCFVALPVINKQVLSYWTSELQHSEYLFLNVPAFQILVLFCVESCEI